MRAPAAPELDMKMSERGGTMNTCRMSLRKLVEKWVGAAHVRVTQFSHTRREPWRYVRIEADQRPQPVTLIFFRHDDGSWCVFPPQQKRPEMGGRRDALRHDAMQAHNNDPVAAC